MGINKWLARKTFYNEMKWYLYYIRSRLGPYPFAMRRRRIGTLLEKSLARAFFIINCLHPMQKCSYIIDTCMLYTSVFIQSFFTFSHFLAIKSRQICLTRPTKSEGATVWPWAIMYVMLNVRWRFYGKVRQCMQKSWKILFHRYVTIIHIVRTNTFLLWHY